MKLVFCFVAIISLLAAGVFSTDIRPMHTALDETHIHILDQKALSFKQINGIGFSEISDLAYNSNTHRLYMVGDEGKLFTFEAYFGNKIEKLEALKGTKLLRKNGKKFIKWQRDSEGMCIGSQGGLLVSFEGDPKLRLFGYDGKEKKEYPLPTLLQRSKNYRSLNKSLESVTLHPRYGALMVSEWPIKKDRKKYQTVYSLSGREWHYTAEPEAKSGTTAIEIMDDGNLLVLERSFKDLLSPIVITLKKVYLEGCAENTLCKSEVLLKMNSHHGWDVDNFEGLARVGKNRYVMVSDDNDNFFQKTLLIYFEVID